MSHRLPRRVTTTVALLALAVVLVGVLVYQAVDAARSHRRSAEGALRDYAGFADWQLTQQAKNGLLTTVITSLVFSASRVNPADLPNSVLTPEEVEAVARRMARWCECLDGVRYFFRYDWADGSFHATETDVPDAQLAWARDTVARYVGALPPVRDRRPTTYGSPDGEFGPLRELAVLLTNDSYVMLVGERAGAPTLLVFVIARNPRDGLPVVVYGYETEPGPFLAPTFAFIHRKNALLPQSLIGGLRPDSVLAITVSDPRGRPLYRSADFWSPYAAADTLDPHFGSLVVGVAIRPELAGRLLVGGVPSSRLPVLLGVFVLTTGLLVVALVQMRRQQELARLRTDFVSGVSHELRTPLAQIRWFAELLHLGKLRSEEERARSAGIIDQEARRLTYLVENVLNFSRSEKGTNRVSPVAVDLATEIREAVEVFAPLARARRVTLRTEFEHALTVMADRDALRQVVINLLENAVKYGPVGQTVIVGTAATEMGARVWVEDEGPGIPAQDRERVWEPYVRLARSAERGTGGSGIGLSVVRDIVTLHGGRAWVEAGERGGARFVFELPRAATGEFPVPREAMTTAVTATG